MIYDELYEAGKKKAKHTVWVFSDLQQARYENAAKCLQIAMDDIDRLDRPAEQIWYLGDSTESANLPELQRMTELQEKAFEKLGIPVCYATGNHDYDYAERCFREGRSDFRMPFYEMIQRHSDWHTTKNCEDLYFKVELGDYMIYFLCDHVSRENKWCATHNQIRYGAVDYPYTHEDFAAIRRDMEQCEKKHLLTAAHCGFPGGNRDSYLLSLIQPLPTRVHLHLYGHSHIGEYRCPGNRVFSKIQWVDWQDIPQVDVSSFENIRGSYCRSVLMQIYEDNTLGLFFRNHDDHRFESAFFPSIFSAEKEGDYARREALHGNFRSSSPILIP